MYEVAKNFRGSQDSTNSTIVSARDRALAFIVEQRADAVKSADGRSLGVQARLSRSRDGTNAIAIDDVAKGLVFDPERAGESLFADDPLRGMWREIAAEVCEKLGFPLEPELFSNMLVAAQLGRLDHASATATAQELLPIFRDSGIDGLYHFFSSLRFACDIDCTAMAARSRIACGDLDLGDVASVETLRKTTDRILGSGAVTDVPQQANRSHGSDNGPLHRHVFKVYLDDHRVQDPALDRGLKHDAVVVANALWPVLAEYEAGLRLLREPVPLREFIESSPKPRVGVATVGEVVGANLAYVTEHLRSGAWMSGTRYYRSPDAFLCAYSDLAAEFEELIVGLGGMALLRDAIEVLRGREPPEDAIDIAMRAIAAANAGLDPTPERTQLIDTQLPGGGWPGFGALYSFGSTKVPRVFFGSPVVTAAFAARALSPRALPIGQARPGWATQLIAAARR